MDQNYRIKLNNGSDIPVIGLGTWELEEDGQVENAVSWALEAGYRHVDTAKAYGNEEGVGKAIKQSGISRGEIFVTTKLWNEDQGYDNALAAIDGSLSRLGMDYVDLYLIHWPANVWGDMSVKREETWKAMEKIYESGKAKAIGISNYTIRHMEEMKNYASVLPAVNQVEFHPFLYQDGLLNYCKERNIVLEAYSPLVRGQFMIHPLITSIAKKYVKSNAQIFIRWSLQHGNIVIPKSSRKERIEENIDVFDFEIAEDDMVSLNALNQNMYVVHNPNDIP